MSPFLEVDGLTKRFPGGTLANDAVSFTMPSGEVIGLLGHNGAGKTTLVRQIVGSLAPTAGTARLEGVDLVDRPDRARELCSIQPQHQVPIGAVTPRRAIRLIGRLRGAPAAQVDRRLTELADRLDLGPWLDRRAQVVDDPLTGGVRRLIAFCMAVVAPGRLVLLDEPTNDVDPVRRQHLWGEVRLLAERGHGVILVTHNVIEVERSVDRVLILDQGRVLADGTPAELAGHVAGRLRVDVVWEAGTERPVLPPFVASAPAVGRRLTAIVERRHLPELMAWGEHLREARLVERFSVGTAGLEDAYAQLVSGASEPGPTSRQAPCPVS